MKKLIIVIILATVASASAQFGGRNRSGGLGSNLGPTGGNCVLAGYRGGTGEEDRSTPRTIDRSGFVYARLRYHPVAWWRQHTPEVPWHHDYPDGDTELPTAVSRLTAVHSTPESYQIVDVDSKELFKYPFIYMSEPGFLDLNPADVKNLREYLDRGGFLFVDDFRGNASDNSEMENLSSELKKLYPTRELVPIPRNHPIFNIFFEVDAYNMLPPYRRPNSGDPQFLGMMDDKDRLIMMVDFNNDLSEYWQTLDVGICSIHEAGAAVQLGVNYVIYAMTH